MELVHKPWTMSALGPRCTAAVRPKAWRRARWSAAHRRYGLRMVAARGGGRRGGHDGAGGALTRDGAVVKRPGDGGKAAVMKARGGGELRRERGGRCGVR
jgi:hypothetical protein